MKKHIIIFLTSVLISSLAFAADKPLKVGFVYVSTIGDAGWTHQHNLGRLAVVKKFGNKISTKYIENVQEGADAERVIRNLASSGYDLIFTTSFGFMNPTLKVAQAFPDVVFEHATGYKTAKNMGNFSPRFYEGRYLGGIAAGSKTKSNLIGYVAAFPIPEVVRGINAFILGAQSVNPKVKIKVIWTNSWFNPGKEREATISLISQGADVLTHHTDTVSVIKTAKDKGVLAVAYHSNMIKHGGKSQIGAIIHKWDKFYSATIEAVLNGKWQSKSQWLGLKDDMVDFIISSDLEPSIKKLIKKTKQDIIEAKQHPFQGPIVDRNGKIIITAGKFLSDQQLAQMDYFVKGVIGK